MPMASNKKTLNQGERRRPDIALKKVLPPYNVIQIFLKVNR